MRNQSRLSPVLALGLSFILLPTTALSTDLIEVYQQAQDNDRTFSAARNDYEVVKQGERQAKGLYYPSLNLSYEHIETDQTINRSDNEVFGSGASDFPTDVLTLSLTQPLFRWDFLSERKQAKAEVRQADYQFAAAEQELILRSAEAYLLSLAAQDNEYVTRSEQEATGQQLALAEKRLDVGLASPTEVNESRARLDLNKAEALTAASAVADRLEGLRAIMGNEPGALKPLADDFTMVGPDPASEDQWIQQAQENNLSIKAAEAALEVADAAYRRQKADRYPTLDLVARFNNRDTGGSLFGGGSDVDTNEVLVRADWTIFQGGVLRAKIKESLYRKQRAEDDLELQRQRVRRETRNAYLGVVTNMSRANAFKSSMEAQDLTVQAKQKGFETGTNSNLEVLDAKRDFFFAQRDYLKARYDYLLSFLDLKRQVGSLSESDLEMINGMLKVASADTASELERMMAIDLPSPAPSGEESPVSVEAEGEKEVTTEIEVAASEQESPGELLSDSTATVGTVEPAEVEAQGVVWVESDTAGLAVATEEATSAGESPAWGSRITIANPATVPRAQSASALPISVRRQLAGHEWLFNLDPASVTNQIASFESESDVVDYLMSANLNDVHYFKSAQSGRTLYYVLQGSYRDVQEAKAAADDVGIVDSWARPIAQVQRGRCEVASSLHQEINALLDELCDGESATRQAEQEMAMNSQAANDA